MEHRKAPKYKKRTEKEDIWVQSLQQHVYLDIAPLAIPDSSEDVVNLRKRFVNNDAMSYWQRGNTHPSFDPNPTGNLESYEFLGDPIMSLCFGEIMVEKHPDIDPETLTNLKSMKIWRKCLDINSLELF